MSDHSTNYLSNDNDVIYIYNIADYDLMCIKPAISSLDCGCKKMANFSVNFIEISEK